jgi:hypothetical protein
VCFSCAASGLGGGAAQEGWQGIEMTAGDNLTDLYKATTFRVESPAGHIDIRVGERHSPLDALLSRHSATEWAYITAWNPGSQPLSADQNALAHLTLLQTIRDRGFVCHIGNGIPDNEGWAPERSVWIAGIGRAEAIALGVRFGQNAIVVGTIGGIAELAFCDEFT